jgi:heterodisulfide reductase subunit B
MKFSFYPGCSLKGVSNNYEQSLYAISKALGIELVELEDWNCCGATSYMSINELLSHVISSRNLAIAEKTGLDLIAACPACYVCVNKANIYMTEDELLRNSIKGILKSAGLEYHGTVRVRHYLDVLVKDIGEDVLNNLVKNNLNGLKVACYYGCQVVRPWCDFDDQEMPFKLDGFIKILGGEPVHFPLKAYCCGGALLTTQENVALSLSYKLLKCASDCGAEIIITTCPMCQINLEGYQKRINRAFGSNFDMPIIYFTQMIGYALGVSIGELAINRNFNYKRIIERMHV